MYLNAKLNASAPLWGERQEPFLPANETGVVLPLSAWQGIDAARCLHNGREKQNQEEDKETKARVR
ncbi:hypothetical protein GCM10023229_16380 [Flavisolibacter ginsenosidimutans]